MVPPREPKARVAHPGRGRTGIPHLPRAGGGNGWRQGRPVLGAQGRPAAWPQPSRPFSPPLPTIPWPRLCVRHLYCGPLGWDVSEPGESDSPSQAAREKTTQPGPHPPPVPRLFGRVRPGGVRGMLLCAGATAPWLPSPRRVLPDAPLAETFLPPAGPRGRSGEREWGRPAERAPGRLAGDGEGWTGCLRRALSRARSRCRCCPCLRGRPAGLCST